MTFPTAMAKTNSNVLELALGESFRIGDYVVTVLDTDDFEVRVMIENIGDVESAEEIAKWDDSWQSRLGE